MTSATRYVLITGVVWNVWTTTSGEDQTAGRISGMLLSTVRTPGATPTLMLNRAWREARDELPFM